MTGKACYLGVFYRPHQLTYTMIRVLLCIGVALFFISQTTKAQNADQWETYHEDELVRISYQLTDDVRPADGINNKVYLLRYENLTDQKVDVSFKRVTWYGDQCNGCGSDSDEFNYTVTIDPSAVAAKGPGERDSAYFIYHSRASGSGRTLSKFELQQITTQLH